MIRAYKYKPLVDDLMTIPFFIFVLKYNEWNTNKTNGSNN